MIKRDSWHFKMVVALNPYYKHKTTISLCPYIRTLVSSVVLHTIFYFGIIGIVAFMASLMVMSLFPYFFDYIPPIISVFGGMAWVIVGFRLFAYVQVNRLPFDKVLCEPLKSKPKKQKTPSIFRLYVKALHDKMCPIVEIK